MNIALSQKIFPAYVITLGVKAIYLLSVKTLQENLHDIAIHVCWRDCVLKWDRVYQFQNKTGSYQIQKYIYKGEFSTEKTYLQYMSKGVRAKT